MRRFFLQDASSLRRVLKHQALCKGCRHDSISSRHRAAKARRCDWAPTESIRICSDHLVNCVYCFENICKHIADFTLVDVYATVYRQTWSRYEVYTQDMIVLDSRPLG